MLICRSLHQGSAAYFLDGRHPGRWSPDAGRLLGLEGVVDGRDLRRVLDGRHPETGRFLPERKPARRRSGWDLMFCAPKSVSLLQATAAEGGSVLESHVRAVDEVILRIAETATVRWRERPAEGLIAASFDHRSNAAGEPHVHSHVVIANLSRAAEKWWAVAPSWQVDRRALGALYHLELRHQLGVAGWDLEWRIRPDGFADIAGASRSALRSASHQSRRVAEVGRYEARRTASPQPWREKLGGVGGTGIEVAQSRAPSTVSPTQVIGPDADRAVSAWLAGRRSDFRRADVIVALASTWAAGAPSEAVLAWADAFCDRSIPVPSPTRGPRWTTGMARSADDRVFNVLKARADAGASRPVRDTETLLSSPAGVMVLAAAAGSCPLLAQADALDRCRAAWSSGGLRAAVACADPASARRWEALTGLPRHRAGTGVDTLVVDRADRLPSPDLTRLVAGIGSSTRIILVEGGTRPRLTNPASHGFTSVAELTGRLECGPHAVWGGPAECWRSPPADLVGRRAAAATLATWANDPGSAALPASGVLMVGLGPEEVRGLNRAARILSGVAEPAAGQAPAGLPGDRVVVLRGGADRLRYGAFGWVVGESADGPLIRWDGASRTRPHDRSVLSRLGLGWAVGPYLAGRTDRPLAVLGPADAVERGRTRVISATVGERSPADRSIGHSL